MSIYSFRHIHFADFLLDLLLYSFCGLKLFTYILFKLAHIINKQKVPKTQSSAELLEIHTAV